MVTSGGIPAGDGTARWGFGRMDGYLCIAARRCQPEVTMRVRRRRRKTAAGTRPGRAPQGSPDGCGELSQDVAPRHRAPMAAPRLSRYPWPLPTEPPMFYDLAPVTRNLLIANVAVFLLQQLMPSLLVPLALWPLGSGYFQPWQVVTNAFMHGGFLHLFFNMYALRSEEHTSELQS